MSHDEDHVTRVVKFLRAVRSDCRPSAQLLRIYAPSDVFDGLMKRAEAVAYAAGQRPPLPDGVMLFMGVEVRRGSFGTSDLLASLKLDAGLPSERVVLWGESWWDDHDLDVPSPQAQRQLGRLALGVLAVAVLLLTLREVFA